MPSHKRRPTLRLGRRFFLCRWKNDQWALTRCVSAAKENNLCFKHFSRASIQCSLAYAKRDRRIVWRLDPALSGRMLAAIAILEMASRDRVGATGSIRAPFGLAFSRVVLLCLGRSDATMHATSLSSAWQRSETWGIPRSCCPPKWPVELFIVPRAG